MYKILKFKGVLTILYLFCFHKYEVPGGKKSRYLGLRVRMGLGRVGVINYGNYRG